MCSTILYSCPSSSVCMINYPVCCVGKRWVKQLAFLSVSQSVRQLLLWSAILHSYVVTVTFFMFYPCGSMQSLIAHQCTECVEMCVVRIQNEADQRSTMDVDDCTCADLQSHTSSMSLVTLVQSNSYLLTHSLLDSLAISHIANYIEYHCP